MKRRTLIVSGAIIIFALVLAACQPFGQIDLARVRRATVQFRSVEVAQAAGYDLVPGLDYCFDNPGVGGMGFHYIDTASMDLLWNCYIPRRWFMQRVKMESLSWAQWNISSLPNHGMPQEILNHPCKGTTFSPESKPGCICVACLDLEEQSL